MCALQNLHKHDAQMQVRLMRELVRTEPEAAVARFESNRYASNEAVIKVRQRPPVHRYTRL